MASVASKFGLGGGGGFNFSKPSGFFVANLPSAYIQLHDSGAVLRAPTSANFWTTLNTLGASVDSAFTADTYKTLLTVSSGAGKVPYLVGPTAPGASETTTWEITVDGTLYTLATLPATGERSVLGVGFNISSTGYTAAAPGASAIQGLQASKDQTTGTGWVGGATSVMSAWGNLNLHQLPMLEFSTSLLVRVKHSANVTDTAATGRQSGLMYMLKIES
jgi:hypothetical protein